MTCWWIRYETRKERSQGGLQSRWLDDRWIYLLPTEKGKVKRHMLRGREGGSMCSKSNQHTEVLTRHWDGDIEKKIWYRSLAIRKSWRCEDCQYNDGGQSHKPTVRRLPGLTSLNSAQAKGVTKQEQRKLKSRWQDRKKQKNKQTRRWQWTESLILKKERKRKKRKGRRQEGRKEEGGKEEGNGRGREGGRKERGKKLGRRREGGEKRKKREKKRKKEKRKEEKERKKNFQKSVIMKNMFQGRINHIQHCWSFR